MSGWNSNDAKDFLDVVKTVANKTFDSKNNILKTALAVVIDASDSINPTIRLLNSPDDGTQDFEILNMSGESLVNGDSVWINYWDGYTNAYIAVKNGTYSARGHVDSHKTGGADALLATDIDAMPESALSSNLLINGGFDIWQRGTSFSATSDNQYLMDRWMRGYSTSDGGTYPTIIHERVDITDHGSYPNKYLYRMSYNGAGTSLGANSLYVFRQRVENGVRLYAGTGNSVTLSFVARSSSAGKKIGVKLQENYGTGGSPTATEVISGANFTLTTDFTLYSHTFTLNTKSGKTFGTNGNDYLSVEFLYMWGSSIAPQVGASTAETFGGSGYTDLLYAQLNFGPVALPFVPRSYADELRLCQRYYEKSYDQSVAPGATVSTGATFRSIVTGYLLSDGVVVPCVTKRTTPTVSVYSIQNGAAGYATEINVASVFVANRQMSVVAAQSSFYLQTTNGDGTPGNFLRFHWVADAEL